MCVLYVGGAQGYVLSYGSTCAPLAWCRHCPAVCAAYTEALTVQLSNCHRQRRSHGDVTIGLADLSERNAPFSRNALENETRGGYSARNGKGFIKSDSEGKANAGLIGRALLAFPSESRVSRLPRLTRVSYVRTCHTGEANLHLDSRVSGLLACDSVRPLRDETTMSDALAVEP